MESRSEEAKARGEVGRGGGGSGLGGEVGVASVEMEVTGLQ